MNPQLKYYKNYWQQQPQSTPQPSLAQQEAIEEQKEREIADREYQVELQNDRYVLDRTRYDWRTAQEGE